MDRHLSNNSVQDFNVNIQWLWCVTIEDLWRRLTAIDYHWPVAHHWMAHFLCIYSANSAIHSTSEWVQDFVIFTFSRSDQYFLFIFFYNFFHLCIQYHCLYSIFYRYVKFVSLLGHTLSADKYIYFSLMTQLSKSVAEVGICSLQFCSVLFGPSNAKYEISWNIFENIVSILFWSKAVHK